MAMQLDGCAICGAPLAEYVPGLHFSEYSCPRCGTFRLEHPQVNMLPRLLEENPETRPLVSAFVYRQNRNDSVPTFELGAVQERDWITQFYRMGFPSTIPEKIGALLKVLAERHPLHGERDLDLEAPDLPAAVAAYNRVELGRLATMMRELGWLESSPGGATRIGAKGYLHLDELERKAPMVDDAFIAMWFSDETAALRPLLGRVIGQCGYRAVFVDAEHFTGFIVDQIIALIRRSRFVVADFSSRPESDLPAHAKVRGGARGGVYWESGFAFGLNKPVIHTCRDDADSRRRTHFDIDQYNTLFWTADEIATPAARADGTEPFASRLEARILAVIGRGSRQG